MESMVGRFHRNWLASINVNVVSPARAPGKRDESLGQLAGVARPRAAANSAHNRIEHHRTERGSGIARRLALLYLHMATACGSMESLCDALVKWFRPLWRK